MEVLKHLFEHYFHAPPDTVRPLQGELGGSGRAIIRLSAGAHTAIGILSGVREENLAFLEFSRHFRHHGLPVPAIYAEDLSQGAYLEEDLGDTTLYQFLSANRRAESISPQVIDAYRRAVAILPRFQVDAGRDLNYKVCYPRSSFDRQSIAWDLNYFKYYFLRLAGIPFNEQALEDDFGRLTRFLLTAPRDYFLYRDFQSRNIMIRDGKPFFLDYQGGRKGALQYDIASLLYDGKADLPPALRQQLLDHYLDSLATHISVDRAAFTEHYYAYVYVRIMQALGAYGFRGFFERKPHFLQSVPYALKNLRWLAENVRLPIHLPALDQAFQAMIASTKIPDPPGLHRRPSPSASSAFHSTTKRPPTPPATAAALSSMPAASPTPAARSNSGRSPARMLPSSTTSASRNPSTSSWLRCSPSSTPPSPPIASGDSRTSWFPSAAPAASIAQFFSPSNSPIICVPPLASNS